mgnify:CR=1 FL=1|jgi:N-acetylglucosamine malate deacetylase 1|tara:strand:+ start:1675 stop:2364 length:690 start_codon:yes stop_codon:yes gene_type:complete
MHVLPKKVLVIVAHQDDETIGCSGFIKKLTDQGSLVDVVFVTSGNTGVDHSGEYNADNIVDVRNDEASRAREILGWRQTYNLGVKTQCVANTQRLFHRVIQIIRDNKPDLVITHADVDKHRDHRAISGIVREACWKAQEQIHPELGKVHKINDLWAMEILDLLPRVDYIIDITKTYESKVEALSVYNSQLDIISGIFNHVDGMAKVRGHAIGKKYGEAFMRINLLPVEL